MALHTAIPAKDPPNMPPEDLELCDYCHLGHNIIGIKRAVPSDLRHLNLQYLNWIAGQYGTILLLRDYHAELRRLNLRGAISPVDNNIQLEHIQPWLGHGLYLVQFGIWISWEGEPGKEIVAFLCGAIYAMARWPLPTNLTNDHAIPVFHSMLQTALAKEVARRGYYWPLQPFGWELLFVPHINQLALANPPDELLLLLRTWLQTALTIEFARARYRQIVETNFTVDTEIWGVYSLLQKALEENVQMRILLEPSKGWEEVSAR